MASTPRPEESDSLASLEERIHRAVQLVSQLRQEKDGLQQQMKELASHKETADLELLELQEQNGKLTEEIELLQTERKQVRGRIEKLLGQMDVLGPN